MVHSRTPELNSGDNRPSVYHDPDIDRWVYRASALGSCDRQLVALRRGMEPAPTPDWLQVRFDEGHDWEARILDRFTDDTGIKLTLQQSVCELNVGKGAVVRGATDGLGFDDQGNHVVVDAKFCGEDLYRKLISKGIYGFDHYLWQQSAYAHANDADRICLALGLKDIVGEGDDRKVVGIKEMHYLWVNVADLMTAGQIKARVLRIENLSKGDGWPDCPTPHQYPCPFDWLHDEQDVAVEVEGELALKLAAAEKYNADAKVHESQAKELKAKAKVLVEEVLAAEDLTADASHKLRAGNLQVTWVYSRTEAAVIEKYERKESVRRFPQFKIVNEGEA